MSLLQSLIEKAVGDLVQSVRTLRNETYPINAQSCREYLETLESVKGTVRKALELEMASAAKMMNTHSPLFGQILLHSLPSIPQPFLRFYLRGDTKQYYISLYQLRKVSSTWKAFVDSTPCLWTNISSGCHTKVLSNALEKSAQALFHIIFTDSTDEETIEPATAISSSDFLAQMGSQIGRWKTGVFHLSRKSRGVAQQYLTGAAPVMESMRLSVVVREGVGMEGTGPVDLFGGQACRLRNLSLKSFPMRWESQILRRVESLEIVGNGLELKMSQLIPILSNNCELKQLSIGATDMEIDSPKMDESSLSLPRLKTCSLLPMPARVTEFLLTQFYLPNCGNMTIALDRDLSTATQIYDSAIRPFHNLLRPTLVPGSSAMEVTKLEFDLHSLQLLLKIPGTSGPARSPTVKFIFSGWQARRICPWVEGIVRGLELQLHLRMDMADNGCLPPFDDPRYIVSTSSDAIDSITSNQERKVGHIILLYWLRLSFVDELQRVRRVFPELKSITIFYYGSIDMQLRDSLELRYKPSAVPNNVVIERPPDLKLNFRAIFGEPDYENARAFVGIGGIKEVVVNGITLSE